MLIAMHIITPHGMAFASEGHRHRHLMANLNLNNPNNCHDVIMMNDLPHTKTFHASPQPQHYTIHHSPSKGGLSAVVFVRDFSSECPPIKDVASNSLNFYSCFEYYRRIKNQRPLKVPQQGLRVCTPHEHKHTRSNPLPPRRRCFSLWPDGSLWIQFVGNRI